MEIAKDGSITPPVDDIPGLSSRAKNGGGECVTWGYPIAEMDRHSKGAQVKSEEEKTMPARTYGRIIPQTAR